MRHEGAFRREKIDLQADALNAYTQLIDQGSSSQFMSTIQTQSVPFITLGESYDEGITVQGKDGDSLTEKNRVEKQKVARAFTFLRMFREDPVQEAYGGKVIH